MTQLPPVKVLMIISHIAMGGAENVALTLMEGLAAKCVFSVFAVLDSAADRDFSEDFRHRVAAVPALLSFGTKLPFKGGGVVAAALQLRRIITSGSFDVIHVHTEIPELTLALALTGLHSSFSKRVLRTVHNAALWSSWESVGRWVSRRLTNSYVACVSQAAFESDVELNRRSGLAPGASPRRTLIYNGIVAPNRTRVDRAAAAGYVEQHEKRLLFAGRFEPQKGVDLLPAILRSASGKSANGARVTLIGNGSLRASVENEFFNEPCGWPIEFIDTYPNLMQQLFNFDLVLVPSRFEGLGLIAIEAGLACVPVAAFDAPGLCEVVDKTDPLSCPVGDVNAFSDRIVKFLDNSGLYFEKARQNSENLSRKFDVIAMCESYFRLYQSIARLR